MKEIECVDIPTMSRMSDDKYLEFLRQGELGGLMYVDHHDVLRSYVADYPLATSREQVDILMEYLQTLRSKMAPCQYRIMAPRTPRFFKFPHYGANENDNPSNRERVRRHFTYHHAQRHCSRTRHECFWHTFGPTISSSAVQRKRAAQFGKWVQVRTETKTSPGLFH